MSATASDLALFADSLESVLAAGDAEMFEEFLRGRHLPALGGNLTPSGLLGRALEQLPDFSTAARRTSQILARILGDEASRFRQAGARLDARHRAVLLGALQLSSSLPADADLALALRGPLAALRSREEGALGEEPFVLWFALWRALARQQVDESLKAEWFALLSIPPGENSWTPEQRTLLLEAWRGLLRMPWMPRGCDVRSAAFNVVDFDRIENGLLAFADAVRRRASGEKFLRYALEMLLFTFPRSSAFWVAGMRKRIGKWPEDLRVEVCRLWPELESLPARTPLPAARQVFGGKMSGGLLLALDAITPGRDTDAGTGSGGGPKSGYDVGDDDITDAATGTGPKSGYGVDDDTTDSCAGTGSGPKISRRNIEDD